MRGSTHAGVMLADHLSAAEPVAPAMRRRRSPPWFPITVMVVMAVCAVFAPLLAPHPPTELNPVIANSPPLHVHGYLLGTDTLGRDMLSRLIYGARTSVFIALIGLGFAAAIGTSIGVASGYLGGRVDGVLMRLVDVTMAFPTILTALVIALFLGEGQATVILAVSVTMWATFARMIRGDVSEIRGRDYVTLAKIAGVRAPTILRRHVIPNVMNTLVVVATLLLSQVILLVASLSYLGVGLPPGAPDWGVMISEGQSVLFTSWWISLFPGIAITVVVLATNLLGDWLRDASDPRLRQL
jgi:peptide/nickel transport system permease protein